ncbi:MAG: hypothetical protein HY236_07630 [Acidobacteria bacterium]|nr:hypothetical protein [Acidobacteriota bacterium]
MDPRLELILTIFTGVAALALVVQMLILWSLNRSLKATQQRITSFADRWEPVADSTWRAVEETRQQVRELSAKLQELAESSRAQVARVDDLLTEVSSRTRTQLERLDRAVVITLDRVEETTAQVQRIILAPVREIQAVAAAIRAVVEYLARRGRPTVEKATQDEELFI